MKIANYVHHNIFFIVNGLKGNILNVHVHTIINSCINAWYLVYVALHITSGKHGLY